MLPYKLMAFIFISAHKMFLKSYEHKVAGSAIRQTEFRTDLFHFSSCKEDMRKVLSTHLLHLWPSAPGNAHWLLCSHGNEVPAQLEGSEPGHAFLPGLHLQTHTNDSMVSTASVDKRSLILSLKLIQKIKVKIRLILKDYRTKGHCNFDLPISLIVESGLSLLSNQ